MDEIVNYKPAKPKESSWNDIYRRICAKEDDGHGSKLIRALSNGENICKSFEGDTRFRVQGTMWQQLGNMGELGPNRRKAPIATQCLS